MSKIKMTIGGVSISATLRDTPTAAAEQLGASAAVHHSASDSRTAAPDTTMPASAPA